MGLALIHQQWWKLHKQMLRQDARIFNWAFDSLTGTPSQVMSSSDFIISLIDLSAAPWLFFFLNLMFQCSVFCHNKTCFSVSHQDHLTAQAWWSGGRGRVTCVDTPSLLLSPEQLHSSSGGLSTLLQGPSVVAAEGHQCVSLFPAHVLPAEIRMQNSNMVAKLSCSHCDRGLIRSDQRVYAYFNTMWKGDIKCKTFFTVNKCSFLLYFCLQCISLEPS